VPFSLSVKKNFPDLLLGSLTTELNEPAFFLLSIVTAIGSSSLYMSSVSSVYADFGPAGIAVDTRLAGAGLAFTSSTLVGAVTLLETGLTSEGGLRPTLGVILGGSALVRSVLFCVRAVEGFLMPNEVPDLDGVVLADTGLVARVG